MGKLSNTYHRDKIRLSEDFEDLKLKTYLDSLMDTWLVQTSDDQLCPKYLQQKYLIKKTRKRTN